MKTAEKQKKQSLDLLFRGYFHSHSGRKRKERREKDREGGRKVAKDAIRSKRNFNVTWELAHCNMCVITRQSQGTNSPLTARRNQGGYSQLCCTECV